MSSDTFFYRVGEMLMTRNNYQPILKDEVKKFGFGSETGIELPFEFDGTVPDASWKAGYQATVLAIKAHEAVQSGTRIALDPAWFQV